MADDQDRIPRDPPTYPYPQPPRRRSLPKRTSDTKHGEPAVKYGPSHPNKTHRRFSSVLKASESPLGLEDPIALASTLGEGLSEVPLEIDGGAENQDHPDIEPGDDTISQLVSPSITSTSLATVAPSSIGSTSSGESGGSTVTERPFLDETDTIGKPATKRKRYPTKKPNAFSFLDSDSPTVTPESIRRSMEEASRRSPTSLQGQSPSTISSSSTSSGFRDDTSDNTGDHETDRSTSPEHSSGVRLDGHPLPNIGPRMPPPNRKRSYGFPEIPQEIPQNPLTPPSDHSPRVPRQGPPQRPARAERLPITGYELLSSRLSASSLNRPGLHLRPIYRRFETLNHRLLLHLQDELCELEDQLQRVDAADTQNRRLPNCIFPASRRAEYMAGGELHWHKTDVLGKIGFKLEQYNRLLSSFRETQGLPVPTLEDIHEYRTYLANHAPIAEVETHFLDPTDDLISVVDEVQEEVVEEAIATPIPRPDFTMFNARSESPIRPRPVSPYRQEENDTETVDNMYDEPPIIPLSIAVTIAIIIPILTFLIIPGYLGRLTVVFLVGLGTLGALIMGRIVTVRTWELLTCVGLYGAVMAVIAGIVA
ncbi:hypothetical protein GGR54DRAFT_641345 [Hypoxylon sp. NC1633]|nr:hypothetical protein GGR54DRAFT_641345 [Hypoxylon sp. NC1633]